MIIRTIAITIGLFATGLTSAKELKPGFDKDEYRELTLISTRSAANPEYAKLFPEPASFKMLYQSAPLGLDNMWDLWQDDRGVTVASIRGTTKEANSWLANIYAAMVPAKGKLQINGKTFDYQLANNPRAAVHVGWLLASTYLVDDMLPRIMKLYDEGSRDLILTGHSQGGAISYLITAMMYQAQKVGKFPADMRIKTYGSAAPKPGNLYFAYEYEALTYGGWAFNVVNAADWVPETPISIQTLNDFNTTNPFVNAGDVIKKQKTAKRIILKHVYKKLSKPALKAQKNYEKYLGKMTEKLIKENIPDFVSPQYYKSNHYVRAGTMIVLLPDKDYYLKYPDSETNIFIHHFHQPYLDLLEKIN
ncbi:MAG: lipase family protein [Bacteroidia bacterium]